ncbi:hypothetical protein U14_00397 [Candidatus Moduliflexus flocculans]|uniref:Uncharacterized protein n=1 Tax=Candidatus Moduliflexus flocculans TaxID=1499966 RepID=A0A0S6VQ06_9BACT|nr:hypothetical protein U14_00397 [Candidatus Moduliflexus flocculans]
MAIISNYGSAIDEAIGASMEKALEVLLNTVADKYNFYYLTAGVRKTKAGNPPKKLLMFDNFGNDYDIDGVIANEAMQPLILFESKYIRYKKHNRDKGSWVCHAHSAIRRRYHSIRSSIAILGGNWSQSSLAMIKSHDINIFVIPFDVVCRELSAQGIDFTWEEKGRDKAKDAWEKFDSLHEEDKLKIGQRMIEEIEEELCQLIDNILDDSLARNVEKVVIELVSNLGEVRVFEFGTVEEAFGFLKNDDLEALFISSESFTLFDAPPSFDEEERTPY